jgi:hypothetical protein
MPAREASAIGASAGFWGATSEAMLGPSLEARGIILPDQAEVKRSKEVPK